VSFLLTLDTMDYEQRYQQILEQHGLTEFNPNHEPTGTPEGGRFASKTASKTTSKKTKKTVLSGSSKLSTVEHLFGDVRIVIDKKTGVSRTDVERWLGARVPASLLADCDIFINSSVNPDDVYWQKQYNMPGLVSEATGGVNPSNGRGEIMFWQVHEKPSAYVAETFAHELGHVYAARNPVKFKDFLKAARSDKKDPSTYAKVSDDENMAESFRLYFFFPSRLKNRCPSRYAWMQEEFKQHEEK